MRRFAVLALAAALMFPVLASAPAQAQSNNRSWVSGVGDGTNDCSTRKTPCASFFSAYGKTVAGGEITCADPGPYGSLTIAKALTISCEEGTTTSLGGFTIDAGASDAVYLKGLGFNGRGSTGAGIKFNSGKSLTIENCHIDGFPLGVSFTPSGASFLNIINTTISNNGLPNIGGGVQIAPGSGGFGLVHMTNVRIIGNYIGIGGSTSGTAIAHVRNSSIADNTSDGISVAGNVTVRLSNSAITGNGGRATSGNVLSFGNNEIVGNNPDTIPATISLR